ncbi:MAG: hypothetical protein U0031_12750 [Thermomicrobiales bacterium]
MKIANRRVERHGLTAGLTMALLALVVVGILGGAQRESLAQEGIATPATPVAVDFGQLVAERPAAIVSGSCTAPGETIATLTGLDTSAGEAKGQGSAIEAERSYTTVPLPLDDLLAGQTSVSVSLSPDAPDTVIACGDLGGVVSEGGSLVVKLSPRNDSGFTGIAFLGSSDPGTTGISVFLAGERTVAETRELAAATPSVELETIPEPTATVEPVQVVDVAIFEWIVEAPAKIRAGKVNLVVTNEGTEPHSLAIESGGTEVASLAEPVAPGAATVLTVTLSEGEYTLYCPLDDGAHRDKGMETTLTVVP